MTDTNQITIKGRSYTTPRDSAEDAYDSTAAKTTVGLYKNEAVDTGSPFWTGPFRALADVEVLTMNYVHWYSHDRRHSELD